MDRSFYAEDLPEGSLTASREVYVTGRRVVAAIIDVAVLWIVSAIITSLLGIYSGESLIFSVLAFSYFTGLEGGYGQTLGKMATGVEVIRQTTGEAPGAGAAALRTVLRIIDGLFFYLVGFIVVLVSERRQRLGDMAAKTLVVRK